MLAQTLTLLVAFLVQAAPSSLAATTVTRFAGISGFGGMRNGDRLSARFNRPRDIAFDSTGNVFVADAENGRIRKIATNGTVSTVVGGSLLNYIRAGRSRRWYGYPIGIAIDASDNIYMISESDHLINKVSPDGEISVFAGATVPGFADGVGSHARFRCPKAITIDFAGNLFVADSANNRIRMVTPDGVVSTVAGGVRFGHMEGSVLGARFVHPIGIAVDRNGNLYVTESESHNVRKITTSGHVVTLAGSSRLMGLSDGFGRDARFKNPKGLAVDAVGNVFVADMGNSIIRIISPYGNVVTVAGSIRLGYANGHAESARFYYPASIAIDSDGNLLVADNGNNVIRKITFEHEDNDAQPINNEPEIVGTIPPKPIDYDNEECAICYDVKTVLDDYDYCSVGCGNTFHKQCIDRCMARAANKKCPMCRSAWIMNKPPVAIPTSISSSDDE